MRTLTALVAAALFAAAVPAQVVTPKPAGDEAKPPSKAPCCEVTQEAKASDKPLIDQAIMKDRKLGLAKPIVFQKDKEVYGAALGKTKRVALAEISKDTKTWKGKRVRLHGKILKVCPKKGCWMMVKDGDVEVRVTFKDYKFFVPLDSAGRDVAADGLVDFKVVSEAERRHYAEDAGASAEEIAAIKGDKTELAFVADAVQVGTLPEDCCEEGAKTAAELKAGAKEGEACSGDCGGCEGEKKEAKPVSHPTVDGDS